MNRLQKLLGIGLTCGALGAAASFSYCNIWECNAEEIAVTSYDECLKQGFPSEDSDPPKCIVSKDKIFEKPAEHIRITSPTADQEVRSGFTVTGEALVQSNTVYYRLLSDTGEKLSEGQTKTTSPEHGRFGAFSMRISFDKKEAAIGTLELYEKNPDGTELSNIKLPVDFNGSQSNVNQAFKPLEESVKDLPSTASIDVPFTPQAPFANWSDTFNEACEEASLIMVEYFLRQEDLSQNIANSEIIDLVDWQKSHGYSEDIDAEELVSVAQTHFERIGTVYYDEEVTLENIKRLIAAGHPVIVPAAGKLLNNPHYRGDGPPYHMLVISGYDEENFITQDPGTREGKNYKYSYDTIVNAIHDWTGDKATIEEGRKAMVVLGK